MEPAQLLSQGINTGVLALAVWYIAKKLASQYESRIAALEAEVKECHADRKAVNDRFIAHLTHKSQTETTSL